MSCLLEIEFVSRHFARKKDFENLIELTQILFLKRSSGKKSRNHPYCLDQFYFFIFEIHVMNSILMRGRLPRLLKSWKMLKSRYFKFKYLLLDNQFAQFDGA